MSGKGGCAESYFQLIICTSFQWKSTLFPAVSVKTYCSFGGNCSLKINFSMKIKSLVDKTKKLKMFGLHTLSVIVTSNCS